MPLFSLYGVCLLGLPLSSVHDVCLCPLIKQLTRLENETDEDYAARSAYMLKPRGRAPERYSDAQYDKRGKKKAAVDEEPPRKSKSRIRAMDYDDASEHEDMTRRTRGRRGPKTRGGPRTRGGH